MSNSIRVKEAIDEKRLPYFYLFICWYCSKLIANGSLITGLTNSGTVVLAKNTLMHNAMVSAFDDHTQTAVAHRYEDEIREYFRQNSRDTEKQAKINSDPTLPAMVGHEVLAARTPVVIPDIYFENTNIIGTMDYRVKSSENVYNYNFEITRLNEDGTVFSVIERQMTNASGAMDGFVSGAKYMIRCQPIFTRNVKGEWTEYFEIRAN